MSPDARGGKSLSLMSGGERTFIDACLTRAVALYLAQNTGRRFDTLFSDEADGPLDPEHKRMFMAMKREVLRLGGYRQEFFITQTPHLATMADAIIDLDAMQVDALRDVALVLIEWKGRSVDTPQTSARTAYRIGRDIDSTRRTCAMCAQVPFNREGCASVDGQAAVGWCVRKRTSITQTSSLHQSSDQWAGGRSGRRRLAEG